MMEVLQREMDPVEASISDEEALARSLREPHLFEVLVDRYEDAFLRKSRSILGDTPEAVDAVQDAFTKIYVYARKFEPRVGASCKSWMYKILINTCLTVYEKRKRERVSLLHLDPEIAEMVPSAVEAAEMERRLDTDYLVSLISRLPVLLQRTARLHFLGGKPQKEIAAIEGTTVGAVRARIHRAKREMKRFTSNL